MTETEKSDLRQAYHEATCGNEQVDFSVRGKGRGWEIFYRDRCGIMRRRYTEDINELP